MTIVGNGDIASALHEGGVDRDDLLFFAAGVSNSSETRESEYQRELDLLNSIPKTAHIVYFSSLCIYYSGTRYMRHKSAVENYIRRNWACPSGRLDCPVRGIGQYTVMRLGNITWGNNPHTLINYLRAHPDASIQDTYRYILDKEEFWHWLRLIPHWNCEMNIPGRRMLVKDIYREFVSEWQPA